VLDVCKNDPMKASSAARRRKIGACLALAAAMHASGWPRLTRAQSQPEPAAVEGPAPVNAPIEGGKRVLVLPAAFTADVPAATRGEFEAAFAEGLARAGLAAVPAPPRLLEQGCSSADCIRATAAMAEADAAVRLRVVASARDYDVVIELFDGERGTLVEKSGERCELCGVAETREVVANHAAALRRRIDAVDVAPPRLQIHSRPARARLSIDGVFAGNAPVARVVSPGRHLVRAELPRHRPVERTVTAVAGLDEIVEMRLAPLPRRRETALWPAGWSVLAVGTAALVAGVVLVAIDGRENRAVCRGDDVDALGNCRYLHRTKIPGIASLVSGIGLVGAGVGLLAAASAQRLRGSRAARGL
jgi:hypothetical protein